MDRSYDSQSNSQGVSSPQKCILYFRDPVWVQQSRIDSVGHSKKKEIYGCFFGRLKCVQFLEGSITDLIEDKRHKYQLLRIIKSFFSSFLLCQIFIFSRPVMVTAQIKWQTLFLNNRANLCRQEFTNWGKAYQSQSDFQF